MVIHVSSEAEKTNRYASVTLSTQTYLHADRRMLASEVLTHNNTLKMLKMSKEQSLYGANMRCKVNFKILMRQNETTHGKQRSN